MAEKKIFFLNAKKCVPRLPIQSKLSLYTTRERERERERERDRDREREKERGVDRRHRERLAETVRVGTWSISLTE